MARKPKTLSPDAPLLFPDHPRPVTRRDFLRQGIISGAGVVMTGSLLGLLGASKDARAAANLSSDILAMANAAGCDLGATGGTMPFICFDLAGGANIAGSNVLVGGMGGQTDFLNAAGYRKLGLPDNMLPSSDPAFIDSTLGLLFHADSAFLRGIKTAATGTDTGTPGFSGNVDGIVIPARSGNDTNTNPHNPMYGIARAGAVGKVVTLIGSRNTDSGGNSIAPAVLMDPELRPTKVDRPSDVTGMVDTGSQNPVLANDDVVRVMESMARISDQKLNQPSIETGLSNDQAIKDLVRCGYVGAANIAEQFGGAGSIDPLDDPDILAIFTNAGLDPNGNSRAERELRKTASVMKMVIDGGADGVSYAGAGTVAMGGYDYHTGDRSTGEVRDFIAGLCMGACLEYARRKGKPLMLYVFSDGSLSSNGTVDDSLDGRGKGVWTGDNSSTAASFFLVFNPGGRPAPRVADGNGGNGVQIGWFRADGSVETAATPAANNVNLLVQTVLLNYLALHGEVNRYDSLFPGMSLGNAAMVDSLTAFQPIV